MWTPDIGGNAGRLWATIGKAGEISLLALKKQSRLDDRQLYMALGWLAREGKLKFSQTKAGVLVALK